MRNGMKRIGRGMFAAAAMAACLTGLSAVTQESEARPVWPPFACPDVYAPVICSDGNIYSNSCYAASYGATGCVPWEIWF